MSAQRGRLSVNHPQVFARRIGLRIRGGTHVTWLSLLDLAVDRYWELRLERTRADDDAA